jgi:hypothetical protein
MYWDGEKGEDALNFLISSAIQLNDVSVLIFSNPIKKSAKPTFFSDNR